MANYLMDDPKQSKESSDSNKSKLGLGMGQSKDSNKTKSKFKNRTDKEEGDVLLKLPGGFKYKLPGKQQRVVLGSIVVGLNALLVLSVALYYYSPSFQEFIYNVGRN